MSIANKLTDEQFKYIKLTVKVAMHPVYGMHLRAKTLSEILNDKEHINYDLTKIKRSCARTKGGFIRESATVARYLTYTSRYFGARLTIATHRLIYMLYHDINLDIDQIINHIDSNTFNNHIDNLEIVSSSTNSHISKSIYRQNQKLSKSLSIDQNSLYRITFTYNNIFYTFGTTKDEKLATTVNKIITDIRINIPESDIELITFIDRTKYKTLEERLNSLSNINISENNFKELYNSIISFNNSNDYLYKVKQSGVRQESTSRFRVEMRVNNNSISFGTYDNLIDANKIAIQVRTLKTTNLDRLLEIINSKPKSILGSSYYMDKLWI